MKSTIHKKEDIKREKEKKVVKLMILKYCKGNNHLGEPCDDCSKLIQYVDTRIDNCPFMETKTYCSNCKVHCFKLDMQQQIKKVMKYSGPRMLFSHPIMVLDHIYQGMKNKSK